MQASTRRSHACTTSRAARVNWSATRTEPWCSPSGLDAGFVVGGQYGEGSLRVGGHTVRYYSTATGSIGWQICAQSRAIVVVFMSDESLSRFRVVQTDRSAGGDTSVAVLRIGANGNLDTSTATGQVNAFVLTSHGLMVGESLEGSKVTRLALL